jgi:hypothetical protein
MTRPARLTQSQVERAIKAAKRQGASAVEVKPDGTIRISLAPVEKSEAEVEPVREIVL